MVDIGTNTATPIVASAAPCAFLEIPACSYMLMLVKTCLLKRPALTLISSLVSTAAKPVATDTAEDLATNATFAGRAIQ